RRRRLWSVAVLFACVATACATGRTQSEFPSRSFLLARTVYIKGCGTGWVLTDKFVVTNAHIGECVKQRHNGVGTLVFATGDAYEAHVAGEASQRYVDLAILELDARVNVGTLRFMADGARLSPGTAVMSMGNPAPSTWLATRYRVLSQPEHVPGGLDGVIVLEGHALEGDSGSPVVTEDGKVVGVLFAKVGTVAYAVPIQPYLLDLVREVRPTALFRAEHFKW